MAADVKSTSAEFGNTLKVSLEGSSSLPRAADLEIENITVSSQPDKMASTLRLPDFNASNASAEEELALRLSRLKTPPRPAATKETTRSTTANSHFSLELSA